MLKYNLVFLLIIISVFEYNKPINFSDKEKLEAKDIYEEQRWVDSIYKKMSFDEKVGQLFMVAAYSNKDEGHYKSIDKLINDYNIGGLIFFQGGPIRQATLTNRYQSESKVPLFIGIDAEWGMSNHYAS